MTASTSLVLHIDKTTSVICSGIIVLLGIGFLWKKQFAAKAGKWPIASAEIENIYIDSTVSGTYYRHEKTHIVLAYSYMIDSSYYSGEIKLMANGSNYELANKELVGKEVKVHYNPAKPEESVFMDNKVGVNDEEGWIVDADPRISIMSWLSALESKLPWN